MITEFIYYLSKALLFNSDYRNLSLRFSALLSLLRYLFYKYTQFAITPN